MSWELVSRFAGTLPAGGLQELGWTQRASGLVLPPGIEPPSVKPLALGLFDGAGGFALGFHEAGWHVIAGNEWWVTAAETYLCNLGSPDTSVYVGKTAMPDATKRERAIHEAHPGQIVRAGDLFESAGTGWISSAPDRGEPCELFLLCDVHELTGDLIRDLLGVDELGCVFGGPPCQGFSVAGKQDPGDGRNQLVFEFARVVCELRPAAFCMENVPGILNMVTPEGLPIIDALALVFERGGMGEHEALKRSLLGTAGLGAAVKGAKKPGRHKAAEEDDDFDDDTADEQLELMSA